MSIKTLPLEQAIGFADRIKALIGQGLPDEDTLFDAMQFLLKPVPMPAFAFETLTEWLTDNTVEVFEEQPEVDDIRSDLAEALGYL